MNPPILTLDGLTVGYHGRPVVVDCRATFAAGGVVGITGPNGAGKTTLLHGILGLAPVLAGEARLDGQPVRRCRQRISLLAQRRPNAGVYPSDARGVVAQGRLPARGWWRGFGPEDHAAVDEAMAAMGIGPWADRPFHDLSGGQVQRVLLARALASGAQVLLLDEPLAGLDPQASTDLLARLRTWAAGGRLALVVLHDLTAADRWCDHRLHLPGPAHGAAPVAA